MVLPIPHRRRDDAYLPNGLKHIYPSFIAGKPVRDIGEEILESKVLTPRSTDLSQTTTWSSQSLTEEEMTLTFLMAQATSTHPSSPSLLEILVNKALTPRSMASPPPTIWFCLSLIEDAKMPINLTDLLPNLNHLTSS
jgi:hypothetical protein